MNEKAEILRKAALDPELSWVLKCVPQKTVRTFGFASKVTRENDPFGDFEEDLAHRIREDPRVRGVYVTLCSLSRRPGPQDEELLKMELRREGAMYNPVRSDVEGMPCFSFSEISVSDEANAVALKNDELAMRELERDMMEFREDELPEFVEDSLKLSVYSKTDFRFTFK